MYSDISKPTTNYSETSRPSIFIHPKWSEITYKWSEIEDKWSEFKMEIYTSNPKVSTTYETINKPSL